MKGVVRLDSSVAATAYRFDVNVITEVIEEARILDVWSDEL
jgi:hypothetical protein